MQSLFLKMTGFQEQKMKCITWELATDDLEYRYERYTKNKLGECSTIQEKNTVLNDLACALNKKCPNNFELSDDKLKDIVNSTKNDLKKFYDTSNLSSWLNKQYLEFETLLSNCSDVCLLYRNKQNLYAELFRHCDNCAQKAKAIRGSICKISKLSEAYNAMIHQRNRYAHNTSSFQKNLPSLDTLNSEKYVLENFFVRFFLLIVIDKIFIELFNRYLDINKEFKL
jgi:hypothetical protein